MMHKWSELLRKFWHLSADRRWLVLEATFQLLLARLALRLLPFRKLTWLLNLVPKPANLTEAQRRQLRNDVSWAIAATAAHLPGNTVCFPRGIAAQAMLRRRGVAATLYYGAATVPDEGLSAHVWVQDGNKGIIGHQEASKFHVLAMYPASA